MQQDVTVNITMWFCSTRRPIHGYRSPNFIQLVPKSLSPVYAHLLFCRGSMLTCFSVLLVLLLGTVTYFFPFLFKPYTTQNSLIRQGQTSIPAKARNSACFREIIGDRVPISIVKKDGQKKCFFCHFFVDIVCKNVKIPAC